MLRYIREGVKKKLYIVQKGGGYPQVQGQMLEPSSGFFLRRVVPMSQPSESIILNKTDLEEKNEFRDQIFFFKHLDVENVVG